MLYTFFLFFVFFVFYSFLGWLYETILCSIEEKHFVKRGFLYGPYCPVYGFGAILNILVISFIENPMFLFLAGMFLTCSLEYFTSWLLEVIFHARWWDYHYMKYNINGRICLLGAVVFGFFSVVLIKVLHPAVNKLFFKISPGYILILANILLWLILFDFICTIIKLSQFNKKLHSFQEFITNKINVTNRNFQLHKEVKNTYNNTIKEKVKVFMSKLNNFDKRLLKSFPSFRSTIYIDAVKKIREYLNK